MRTTKTKKKIQVYAMWTWRFTNHKSLQFYIGFGRFNTCQNCPPYKKYAEFGGQTVWECMETEPEQTKEKITDVGK
jgi:hypothetical protein